MLGGMGSTTKDIPPFILQQGQNCVTGLNSIGMRRLACRRPRSTPCDRPSGSSTARAGPDAALDQIEAELGTVSEVAEFVGIHPRIQDRHQPMRSVERGPNIPEWARRLARALFNGGEPGIHRRLGRGSQNDCRARSDSTLRRSRLTRATARRML